MQDDNREQQDDRSEDKDKKLVEVFFERKPEMIERGKHDVSELKTLFGVPADYALAEVIDGKITPLKDDANVTIKGGEQFFKGPKTGGSSHG